VPPGERAEGRPLVGERLDERVGYGPGRPQSEPAGRRDVAGRHEAHDRRGARNRHGRVDALRAAEGEVDQVGAGGDDAAAAALDATAV
jgi:hypothetical protein